MPRSDRLLRLLQHLRTEPAPVTAARLADLSGVSERAIYRDVAALRSAGAVIDGQAGYGYTLTEDSALPPQMLSRLEIEAVIPRSVRRARRGGSGTGAGGHRCAGKNHGGLARTSPPSCSPRWVARGAG